MLLAITSPSGLNARTVLGLVIGLVGVSAAGWWRGHQRWARTIDRLQLAVLVGAASWAIGVVYSQRAPLPVNPLMRTATTLLCGSALLLTAAAIFGEYKKNV